MNCIKQASHHAYWKVLLDGQPKRHQQTFATSVADLTCHTGVSILCRNHFLPDISLLGEAG